ncbi:MAG: Uma2 family endonuclease [Meiothermus sp.]
MPRPTPPTRTGMSFEEYLEFEKTASERHEFVDGQLFMMAGERGRHNRMAGRIYNKASALTEGSPCSVYINGVKVRTPDEMGYYPDVFATCEDEESDLYKRFPCFIVEVLSETTEAVDRGEKLSHYRLIPTLQTYVLISQDEVRAEVYSRLDEHSWRYEVIESGGMLRLPCVGLEIRLDEIYAGL